MQKFSIIALAIGVLALAALVGYRENSLTIRDRWPVVACTMEAKICPDGTAVGRQGPNCEFTPCPQPKPTAPKDPACDGEANEYYSLGFGVEHRYEGKIAPGKPVSVTLSCDHLRLTISGAVSQVITAEGDMNEGAFGELADLSSGSLVVSLEDDYNFDGYSDLSSIVSNGQGMSAVDTFVVFLYDPAAKRFAYSQPLSAIENLWPDPETQTIRQEFCYFESEKIDLTCERAEYRWLDGRLVEIVG
jgi:hypothetical protein